MQLFVPPARRTPGRLALALSLAIHAALLALVVRSTESWRFSASFRTAAPVASRPAVAVQYLTLAPPGDRGDQVSEQATAKGGSAPGDARPGAAPPPRAAPPPEPGARDASPPPIRPLEPPTTADDQGSVQANRLPVSVVSPPPTQAPRVLQTPTPELAAPAPVVPAPVAPPVTAPEVTAPQVAAAPPAAARAPNAVQPLDPGEVSSLAPGAAPLSTPALAAPAPVALVAAGTIGQPGGGGGPDDGLGTEAGSGAGTGEGGAAGGRGGSVKVAELLIRAGEACPTLRRPPVEDYPFPDIEVAVAFVVDKKGKVDPTTVRVVPPVQVPREESEFFPRIYVVGTPTQIDSSLSRAGMGYDALLTHQVLRHILTLPFRPALRNGRPISMTVLVSCQAHLSLR